MSDDLSEFYAAFAEPEAPEPEAEPSRSQVLGQAANAAMSVAERYAADAADARAELESDRALGDALAGLDEAYDEEDQFDAANALYATAPERLSDFTSAWAESDPDAVQRWLGGLHQQLADEQSATAWAQAELRAAADAERLQAEQAAWIEGVNAAMKQHAVADDLIPSAIDLATQVDVSNMPPATAAELLFNAAAEERRAVEERQFHETLLELDHWGRSGERPTLPPPAVRVENIAPVTGQFEAQVAQAFSEKRPWEPEHTDTSGWAYAKAAEERQRVAAEIAKREGQYADRRNRWGRGK